MRSLLLVFLAAGCDALKTKSYVVPGTLQSLDITTSHNKAYLE